MKKIILLLLAVLFCTACTAKSSNYISMTVTPDFSEASSAKINVFKYDFKGDPVLVGSVPYTFASPLAVYDERDNSIYYSANNDVNEGDQLWQYNIDTKESKQLTNSLFKLFYIIPRKDDIVLVGHMKDENTDLPFIYDKKTSELTKLDPGFDFDCNRCTYNPLSNKILLAGNSYSERQDAVAAYEAKTNPDSPDLPPSSYFLELDGRNLNLLLKLDQYSTDNIAIIDKDNFYYRGNPMSMYAEINNYPLTQFKFNTKGDTTEYHLFNDTTFYNNVLTSVYYEFVFTSKDDIYFLGNSNIFENNPRGLFHYNISNDKLEPVYEDSPEHGSTTNFVFLEGK